MRIGLVEKKPQPGDVREDGFIWYAGKWVSPAALERKRERDRQWVKDNPGNQKERVAEWARKNRKKKNASSQKHYRSETGRSYILWRAAKGRAEKYGLPFTITREWVEERVIGGVCAVTGIPFDFTKSKERSNPRAPSLDQITAGAGYTPENTQVIMTSLNYAKNEMSFDELVELCHAVAERYPRKKP